MVIEVKNLSKRFLIPHEKRDTLFERIICFIKGDIISHEEFYALKNINFSVKKGEFIGIVGSNGGGKTVLLALLSKILIPTTGTVTIRGKVVSFLELGVGFQEDLTARENIYLYGAVMGLSKKYIDSKFDRIIKFAGVKKFVDAKLKIFSAGMKIRLAFSTAIQTNSDIYLLDEVLAMGDKNFEKKCLSVFKEFRKNKKTVLIASHRLRSIKKLCKKTMLIDKGKIIMFDNTNKVLRYYKNMKKT